MPWKNGGGTTREIFRFPATGNWSFRLSIAEVKESGPFSIFSGMMRHLLLLTGKGMILHGTDFKRVMDKSLIPYTFDGEISINAELISGPNTDFNVFWDKNLYQCDIEIIEADKSQEISVSEDESVFIYSLVNDECQYFSNHSEVITVMANSILVKLTNQNS